MKFQEPWQMQFRYVPMIYNRVQSNCSGMVEKAANLRVMGATHLITLKFAILQATAEQ